MSAPASSLQTGEPLLIAQGLSKRFGGLQALKDVSFEIRKGEIFGLIGPNGAGKTTLFNVMTALYIPESGSCNFQGVELTRLKPHQIADKGLARTFQNIRLFSALTALENVMIGQHLRTKAGLWGAVVRNKATRDEEARVQARALELLDYVGIGHVANEVASSLSYGDQRRLEIARALATGPALLALDEPAAGSIDYQGRSLAGQPVHAMVRQGLVMVPGGRGIFPQLTIEENLHMGAYSRQDKINFAQELQQVYQRFPRLAERRLQTAGTLSGGEQQLLAMGRAILSKPKLLLLDEPTMGLAPIMVDKIFEVIEDIAQQGVTILLIEQNARLALEVSQRGYVLESGELTLQGPARDLLHDPKVRAAYLGE